MTAIPPGTYAAGARSPVAWVYLCPQCGGYAPITAEDYSDPLSGTCQGCGSGCRERHRFPALIDSAAGCGCRGQHPRVTGDLAAAGSAAELVRWLRAEAAALRADTAGGPFQAAYREVTASALAAAIDHITAARPEIPDA
jgi:hypothetical protein